MEPLANFHEHRIYQLRRDWVENVPDLIHTGDLVYAKRRQPIVPKTTISELLSFHLQKAASRDQQVMAVGCVANGCFVAFKFAESGFG